MKKINADIVTVHLLALTALSVAWTALHFHEPDWNLAGPWLAAVVLILGVWGARLSRPEWLVGALGVAGLGGLSLAVGPNGGLILLGSETLMLLAWDRLRERRARGFYFLALALVALASFGRQETSIYAQAILIFICARTLLWPLFKDENPGEEFLSVVYLGVGVMTVRQLGTPVEFDGGEIILAAFALLNAVLGRRRAVLVLSLMGLLQLDAHLVFLCGPLLLALSAQEWGYRIMSVVLVAATVPVLGAHQNTDALVGAGLLAAALGWGWWRTATDRPRWWELGSMIAILGAAIYLNRQWFLEIAPLVTGLELVGAAAFTALAIFTAIFRHKIKPVPVRLPRIHYSWKPWKFSYRFHPPRLALPPAFANYYLFILFFLALMAAVIWGAEVVV